MPNAQGGTSPKGSEKDYKAFFDKYVEGKANEKARLQASLNPKMSESEKLSVERQIFNIEREMFQMEVNPAPQLNQVEAQIKAMNLSPSKEKYLLDAASKVESQEDAQALLGFIQDFTAVDAPEQKAPASLETPGGEDGGQAVPVGFSKDELVNPETRDIAKANLAELIGHIGAKE